MEYITLYLTYALYALVCYLPLALVLKLVMNATTKADYCTDNEILSGNLAVGMRRGGAHLGLAVAMIGVASGASNPDLVKDMIGMFGYGALAVGFMLSSLFVTDKLILPGVDNNKALGEGNAAVGAVEFGALLMTGIVAYASIYGDGGNWISSMVYFVAGQASLVLVALVYEKLFKGYALVDRIKNGELASGIYLAGKLIAYGLVLQSAIVGHGKGDLSVAVADFATSAIGGFVLLFAFEWIVDKLIVTSTSVKDILAKNQPAAAIQLCLPKIGFAMFLGIAML